jgi:hypothetical protein
MGEQCLHILWVTAARSVASRLFLTYSRLWAQHASHFLTQHILFVQYHLLPGALLPKEVGFNNLSRQGVARRACIDVTMRHVTESERRIPVRLFNNHQRIIGNRNHLSNEAQIKEIFQSVCPALSGRRGGGFDW